MTAVWNEASNSVPFPGDENMLGLGSQDAAPTLGGLECQMLSGLSVFESEQVCFSLLVLHYPCHLKQSHTSTFSSFISKATFKMSSLF